MIGLAEEVPSSTYGSSACCYADEDGFFAGKDSSLTEMMGEIIYWKEQLM
jgi:hypothetical protein